MNMDAVRTGIFSVAIVTRLATIWPFKGMGFPVNRRRG
jgi:hypothetical protein